MNRIILTVGPSKQRIAVDMGYVYEVVERSYTDKDDLDHAELSFKKEDRFVMVNETFDEVLRLEKEGKHPLTLGKFSNVDEVETNTIIINGHAVPKPESEALKCGERYFFPLLTVNDLIDGLKWDGDSLDCVYLGRGLIHKTPEAALTHANALLSFTKIEEGK